MTKEHDSLINIEDGAIIGGNVTGRIITQGDMILGAQINITNTLKMPSYVPPPDLEQLRTDYLEHLRRTYRALDFKGIPQLENFSRELQLEEVYVPLVARPELPAGETWMRPRLAGRLLGEDILPEDAMVLRGGVEGPLRVEEALGKQPRVVVLGDPGSGKTTLLKHLTLHLATEAGAPLPILIPLNAYAVALAQGDCSLQDYLPQYFAGMAQGVASLKPLFDSAIGQGQSIILLDGLDEVQTDRQRLVHKVEVFANEAVARGNKLVITSRIVGYRESPLDAKNWNLYTLLDFNRPAIEAFASRWCEAFEKSVSGDTSEAKTAAETERRSLLEALDANPGVMQLASNPLLLTILALIKRQGVTLPNRRVELYELYLKTLITAWSRARALDKRPVGPALDYLQTIAVLGPLALWLREENPTAGLVPEERLLEWLTGYYMGEAWGLRKGEAMREARSFLDSVQNYSNLLLERGQGRFGFIHMTFEEALAARGLEQAGQLDLKDSLAYIQRHLTEPGWRETILLAVGIWGLIREKPLVAGKVVRSILEMKCAGKERGQNILIAGACLEDVGELGLGRAAAKEVTDALLAACQDRSLPPPTQREAGFILGRTVWKPLELDIFIPIPAGPFQYGDEKHKVMIKKPYEIAKYPVTNSQYREFICAKGYERQEFWSEDGWAWRTGSYDSKAPKEDQDWLNLRPPEKRSEPFYWHYPRRNNPLAPVMGVSWFEAEAYCAWLAEKLGKPIRLPTEEEWERAARHTDGCEYPWGNIFDFNCLNSAEFWGGDNNLDWDKWLEKKGYEQASTTIVVQFPQGDSIAGASDMCGNVWEWTLDLYQVYQGGDPAASEDFGEKYRVLRGGSWRNRRGDARCASRGRYNPGSFSSDVGFRVVSPGMVSVS